MHEYHFYIQSTAHGHKISVDGVEYPTPPKHLARKMFHAARAKYVQAVVWHERTQKHDPLRCSIAKEANEAMAQSCEALALVADSIGEKKASEYFLHVAKIWRGEEDQEQGATAQTPRFVHLDNESALIAMEWIAANAGAVRPATESLDTGTETMIAPHWAHEWLKERGLTWSVRDHTFSIYRACAEGGPREVTKKNKEGVTITNGRVSSAAVTEVPALP